MVTPAASAPRTPAAPPPPPPPPKAEPPKTPVSSATSTASSSTTSVAPGTSTTPAPPKADPGASPPQAAIDDATRADARRKAASDPRALQTERALHSKVEARPPSPAELQGDPRFQRLPRETRSEVLSSLDRARDGASRDNISRLAINDGFAKLGPAEQKQYLDTLGKNPGSKAHGVELDTLAKDPGFAKLSPETRSATLTKVGEHAADPAASTNIGQLARSEGFGKLDATGQKKSLEILAQNPKSAELRGDLEGLGKDPAFAQLSPAVRASTLEQLGNHPGQPGAAPMTKESGWAERKVLKDLATSPGFAGLDEKEQLKMLQINGGKNEQISAPARVNTFMKMDSEEYKNATPAQQTAQLRKYMADNAQAPGGASTPAGTYDHSTPPVLTGPKEVSAPFQTGYAKADRYEMQIDDRTIPIIVAKNQDPKKGQFNTAQELAAGIQALPKHSRDAIKEVKIEPNGNPDDAYWRSKPTYGKDHVSYMTCGADGTVRVYPMRDKQDQHSVDSSLAHETGHTLSQRRWGPDTNAKKWDEWKDAAKKDGIIASQYAKASPAEDFSETLVLYNSVKGKPEEAEVRAMMPERFRVLDEMLAPK